jgi:hypothetical protein
VTKGENVRAKRGRGGEERERVKRKRSIVL